MLQEKTSDKIRSYCTDLLWQRKAEEMENRNRKIKKVGQEQIQDFLQRKAELKVIKEAQSERSKQIQQDSESKYKKFMESRRQEQKAQKEELALQLRKQMEDKKI